MHGSGYIVSVIARSAITLAAALTHTRWFRCSRSPQAEAVRRRCLWDVFRRWPELSACIRVVVQGVESVVCCFCSDVL